MASKQDCARSIENSALERYRSLLRTGDFCDVTFVVSRGDCQKEFRAHRVILATASSVFQTMFYGSLPERETPIQVPDLHPDGFDAMLRYVYGDTVQFSSVDNAVCILAVASKYLMDGLKGICCDYITVNVTPGIACYVYEAACLYDMDGLKQLAVDTFIFDAETVINDDSFLSAQQSTVQTILRQDTLTVYSERQLFDAVLRWGKANAIKERDPDGDKTVGDIRAVVVPLLPYIRFLSMSAVEFTEGPVKSGVLTDEEILPLVMNLYCPGSRTLPSWVSSQPLRKIHKEKIMCLKICKHVHDFSDISDSYSYRGALSYIYVLDKTIMFRGITLPVVDLENYRKIQNNIIKDPIELAALNSLAADFYFTITGQDYTLHEFDRYKIDGSGECRFELKKPQVVRGGERCEINISFKKSMTMFYCRSPLVVKDNYGVTFQMDGGAIHSVLYSLMDSESG